jgi:hypothetical protein
MAQDAADRPAPAPAEPAAVGPALSIGTRVRVTSTDLLGKEGAIDSELHDNGRARFYAVQFDHGSRLPIWPEDLEVIARAPEPVASEPCDVCGSDQLPTRAICRACEISKTDLAEILEQRDVARAEYERKVVALLLATAKQAIALGGRADLAKDTTAALRALLEREEGGHV